MSKVTKQLPKFRRILTTFQVRTFSNNTEIPPPEKSPISPENPLEVPKIDRSRPLPPPAYAGSRLDHVKPSGEDRRASMGKQCEKDMRDVSDETQTTRERDLAKMRNLGIMNKDQPEREIEDHKRK